MLDTLIQLIATPFILQFSPKLIKGVYFKDLSATIKTTIAIFVVGFLIGWLITLLLNIITLGIFWIFGLGFITRTIAYAIVIELIDKFQSSFETKGFLPSLWLSVLLALAWSAIEMIF